MNACKMPGGEGMRDLFEDIEDKGRYIRNVALILMFYNVFRVVAVILAPYGPGDTGQEDIGIIEPGYKETFASYLLAEGEKLQIAPAAVVALLIFSAVLALGYIVGASFLARKKRTIRKPLLFLGATEVSSMFVFGAWFKILPSKISIIVIIFLFFVLLSPSLSKELK